MEIRFLDESAPIEDWELDILRQFDSEGILDYLHDPFTFEVGIVYEHDKPIACGLIRVVEEFKVFLKPDLSNRSKAVAIRDLLAEGSKRRPCNESVVFITDGGDHYVNFLKKHFGFYNRKGIALGR